MSYKVNLISKDGVGVLTTLDITSNVPQGFSFVEKLDESLDVGQMTIRNVLRSEPYTMFDTVEVEWNGTVKFSMRISGDNVTLISKNPLRYEHVLTLVEHTKVLERFIVRGKTFTQPTDGSTAYTLYSAIDTLRKTNPFETTLRLNSTRIFEMPTGDLKTYLESIESPEFTFKDITLREALNQVCGYVEGIPRLDRESDGTLRLNIDFVNEPNNELPIESGNFLSRGQSQSTELYGTNLISTALNIVSDNQVNEAVEIYPSQGGWVTPRSDNYIFDFLKSYIPTPKRIYKIEKLQSKINFEIETTSGGQLYDTRLKYFYFDNTGDFPTTGLLVSSNFEVYYVDMSSSEDVYEWDGVGYVLTGLSTGSALGKARLHETLSDFNSSSTTGKGVDIFVDTSTGKTYRYDLTLTTYVEMSSFDEYGNLLINLTPRILEKNAYERNIVDDGSNSLAKYDSTNFFQANTLPYTFREKNITLGLTNGLWDSTSNIQVMMSICVFTTLKDEGYIASGEVSSDYSVSFYTTSLENNGLYRVHYTPIPNSQQTNVTRQDTSEVGKYSEIISNQQDRIVNLENFSNNLKGKINRIGNSELQLEHRLDNVVDSKFYELKDYTSDNFIITQRETIIKKDYIYVKYGLNKNFNMISKFIGVNSEIRQYEIGENNTLDRILDYQEHIELDAVNSGTGDEESLLLTSDGIKCYMDTLYPISTLEPVRGGYIDTSGVTQDLLAPFSSNGGGDTLMFFQQIASNKVLGEFRDEINSQVARDFSPYTLEDGKFESVNYTLYDKVIFDLAPIEDAIEYADNLPKFDPTDINKSYIDTGSKLMVFKDNRENIGALLSFAQRTKDTSTAGIGRYFSLRNRLVSEDPPTSIKLYTYDTEKLNLTNNLTVPSGYDTVTTLVSGVNIVQDYVNYTTTITNANLTSSKTAWLLADENDKVLFWKNQDGTLLNVITYDFKNKSSFVNYKY